MHWNPPDGNAIGNAEWTGLELKPLLDRADIKPNAVYAAVRAADGYSTGIPITELMRNENWLAYRMNGEPAARAWLAHAHFHSGEIWNETAQMGHRDRICGYGLHRLLGSSRLE